MLQVGRQKENPGRRGEQSSVRCEQFIRPQLADTQLFALPVCASTMQRRAPTEALMNL